MKVIKRNGKICDFDIEKINLAIEKAFQDERKDHMPDSLKATVKAYFDVFQQEHDSPAGVNVSELDIIIETILMQERYFDVARSYILYRDSHRELRFIKDRLDYMERYMSSDQNAATSSETDANANVTIKNVANLEGEVYKGTNRVVQRYRMHKKLDELFPEVADSYLKDLRDHIIYFHDEASSPVQKPYCQSGSLVPFLWQGTSPLDGLQASAPKNLNSFCGQFSNLVFLLSAQVKGAVAYSEFFIVFNYFCIKDFGEDYRKYLDEFVYLGPKMRTLMRQTGRWYATIDDLRKAKLPSKEAEALRDQIVEDATRPATDEELEAWRRLNAEHPGAFDLKLGDGTRTIASQICQSFQQIIYCINQPAGNRSYQSPFTNISYYDRFYYEALFSQFTYPDYSKPKWEDVSFLQKFFMKWFNRERNRTVLTFPVETMALLTDGKDYRDKDYKAFTAEMYAEGHSFFTYVSDSADSLASCCRLRNEIKQNTFSFTNGLTGVQTGSVAVITLNHSRILQDWANENDYDRDYLKEHFRDVCGSYKEYLTTILERVYKYHKAYKSMIYDTEKAGMLKQTTSGFISIKKLFSTIGDNGLNEAAEFIGLECNYNEDYKFFCNLVTGTINEQNRLHSTDDFMFNQEFVPAESLSSKNLNWDKADGYWVPEGRILYNSYFYRADDKQMGVVEKFRMHGREFTRTLDGGVGLHVNLEKHLSKTEYMNLLEVAVRFGTSYFTFNVDISECKNPSCHHIEKKHLDRCPKCGGEVWHNTRVIGYLIKEDDADSYRHREIKTRVRSTFSVSEHLRYAETMTVLQEVPDEIALAINITGCPMGCDGCHSPWLSEDKGEELTEERLLDLARRNEGITCIAIMGGDSNPNAVLKLARRVKKDTSLKVCWYTGRTAEQLKGYEELTAELDYIKIGPYVKELGALDSPSTNQRFYKVEHEEGGYTLKDMTERFRKNIV